tara:strand:- start:711 stop:1094 length:384 start_codon:yes stop_codon:yes gene_type:complete
MRQSWDVPRYLRNSWACGSLDCSNESGGVNNVMELSTLRDCLNFMNREFRLNHGRGNIIALWNKRNLRKFSPDELQQLYFNVSEELMLTTNTEALKMLRKLKTKVIEVIIDEKYPPKKPKKSKKGSK